jgi:hypothetical protein
MYSRSTWLGVQSLGVIWGKPQGRASFAWTWAWIMREYGNAFGVYRISCRWHARYNQTDRPLDMGGKSVMCINFFMAFKELYASYLVLSCLVLSCPVLPACLPACLPALAPNISCRCINREMHKKTTYMASNGASTQTQRRAMRMMPRSVSLNAV